jgi:hypothetical protein
MIKEDNRAIERAAFEGEQSPDYIWGFLHRGFDGLAEQHCWVPRRLRTARGSLLWIDCGGHERA